MMDPEEDNPSEYSIPVQLELPSQDQDTATSSSQVVSSVAPQSLPNPISLKSASDGSGDESWETKYAKLREVALKLKKSVVEKTQEIERLQSEKTSSKSQNISTIQQQYDKALDDVEKYKKLQASLQKDLQTSIKESVRLKQENFDYKSQVKSLTESTNQLTEKLASNQTREDEAKILYSRVEELETELKTLKEDQVDIKQEKRQRAMLSLEITDYEKKLADANEKVLGLQRELDVRQNVLQENDKLMAASEMKLKNAENTIGDLNYKIEQFQNEVSQKSEKITFLQTELSKLNEKFAERKSELANLTREYDTAKLNFSTESSVLMDRYDKMSQTLATQEYKISVLEEHKRSRESHISNLKLELVQLESEFGNYKLKAKSMLNTQKPGGIKSSAESEELENLQRILQDFHLESAILKSDLQTMKLENETLCMERAELGLKLSQMKTAAVEKDVIHDAELQKLKEVMKQKDCEILELINAAKTEKAALTTSYQVKMNSMKSEFETTIRRLENQILNLKLFNESLQDRDSNVSNAEKPAVTVQQSDSIPTNVPLSIDTSGGVPVEQVRMMPRGECEGSENNQSPLTLLQTPSAVCDLTFEQLLSTDMENLSRDKYPGPYSHSDSSKDSQVQVFKEELVRCHSQIKHLQNILRESESNCERLTQLSEALKQEIRRVERDTERKEHLKENTEYLKNIILKFVTLHGGDEKRRLIPVITTMLRLSPREILQMEAAVTGHPNPSQTQIVQDGGSSSGGWSSYVPLPKWSFGSGGG